ncbi:MAG: aminopeptidase N [Limisphaerales bacterium]|jgi:aminopeptidase N
MKIQHLLPIFLAALIVQSCSSSKEAVSTEIDREAIFEKTKTSELDPLETSPFVDGKYKGSFKRDVDLIHTKLEVSFNWEESQILGKATLILKPYFYPVSEVTLDARGMDINEVAIFVDSQKIIAEYSYEDPKLTIELNKEYIRSEEFMVFIDYTGKPEELNEGGSEAITSDKGLYFINPRGEDKDKPTQLWTQGETEANSTWFPTIDKPIEKTTQEIYITVNEKYKTLSNGELKAVIDNEDGTRTDYWVMDKRHTPYLFMMAVGEFAVITDSWQGIPVDYYVSEEYAPYAKSIFGNTPEMLTFYSDILGVKYPWPKYSQIVVEDFVSGAMENTTATIHFDGLNKTDRELLDETHEDIIAHELFHHWFGDLVTCESWANLPLNESFATYGEYLWIEYKYGRDEADLHINSDLRNYLSEASRKQEDLIRFDYGDREQMFDGHSYAKGGRVLHMLRKYVGDEAFFESLKQYLTKHAYTDVEIHELRLVFEDVVGEDLNWFFGQWFLSSGHAELEVDYNKDETTGNWSVTIKQVQSREETPVYILPIAIDVYENGKVKREIVRLESRAQTFELDAINPDWINVDAEKMVLGKVKYNMPEEWFGYQLENGPLYMDRLAAVKHFEEKQGAGQMGMEWLAKAMGDKFWGIQEEAVSAIDVDGEVPFEIRDKMEDLAKNHVKSDVRAQAIRKLGKIEGGDYGTLFKDAFTSDPSWMVSANGLRQYGNVNSETALTMARTQEGSENTNMIMVVLGLYAEYGNSKHHRFFKEKLSSTGGFQQYFVMQEYGEYLVNQKDHSLIESGAQTISDAALNSEIWWMPRVAQGVLGDLETSAADQRKELAESDVDFTSKVEKLDEHIKVLSAISEELSGEGAIKVISSDD